MNTKTLLIIFMISCLFVVKSTGSTDPTKLENTQISTSIYNFDVITEPISPSILSQPGGSRYDVRENLFYLTFKLKGGPGLNWEIFKKIADKISEKDAGLNKTYYEMFRSNKYIVHIWGLGSTTNVEEYCYEIGIAASSIDQIEKLMRAFIEVCNHYWETNRQETLILDLNNSKTRLVNLQEDLKKQEDQQATIDKALKDLLPIEGQKTVGELKTKFILLDVETVGIRARIDAAQHFLDQLKNKATSSQNDQLESIKITAQIDLAGLLAQQQRISEILDSIGHLLQLSPNIESMRSEIVNLEKHVSLIEAAIQSPFVPFQVIGKATIQPIDWKSQEQK